jgi:phosphoribosylglycinamide formyltransferase-1/phosphoribosylamine--glycine ligase/phosphoribosylglycinamide formyltransferase/phosphoribosylformylglycinamidine cyclo-ligase
MIQRKRVGVLISGRGSNMAALISAAQAPDYPAEIVLVLSDKESAAGLERARAAGVDTRAIPAKPFGGDREAHERAVDSALRAAGVEVLALAGYMRLLTSWFVGAWRGRMLNVHPSLLPLYPGLGTHARALEAGDAEAGCTVHLVTDEMDAGPILAQARVPVLAGDDEASLAARVLAAEHALYPRVLADFCRAL